jgi:pimeloyl-ACP methyl ester carboxylesterase
MTTICLVHGAWHGAWCFDLLEPELKARGFGVVKPNLPAEDPGAGTFDYAQVVIDALKDIDDDVVLVGHSLGGMTIPLVAERRPVSRLVFLTGLPPLPGTSMYEAAVAYGVEFREGFVSTDEGDGTASLPPGIARKWFFADVSDELAEKAEGLIGRQAMLPMTEPSPVKGEPEVPFSFIGCTEDMALAVASVRKVAQRYGVPYAELPGSHSPFLSRPGELADLLKSLADQSSSV